MPAGVSSRFVEHYRRDHGDAAAYDALARRYLRPSMALGSTGWLRTVLPDAIPRAETVGLDTSTLLFAAGLSIGSTVLFGSLPAIRSMAPDLGTLLNSAPSSPMATGGMRRLRELMVVVEVALAVVLLVGAGLMVRSFEHLSEVEPGFRQDDVISMAVQLPRTRRQR